MPRDLRKYASQTKLRLVLGLFILVFILGLGLIWWLYGRSSALLGLLCLLGALLPVGVIGIFIFILDIVVKNRDRD